MIAHLRRSTPPARVCNVRPTPRNHPLFMRALGAKQHLFMLGAAGPPAPPPWCSYGVPPNRVNWFERYFMDPRDQMDMGECTGFSEAEFRELSWAIAHGRHLAERRSPSYVWARARIAEDSWPRNTGTMLANGFAVMEAFGICSELDFPFDDRPDDPIPAIADVDAAEFRIQTPCTVDMGDAEAVKRVLAAGMPISIGFPVFESYERVAGSKSDGVLPMPDPARRPCWAATRTWWAATTPSAACCM